MKQKYKISVESSSGDYEEKKEFSFTVEMTPQEFCEFCDVVICEFPHLQTPVQTPEVAKDNEQVG